LPRTDSNPRPPVPSAWGPFGRYGALALLALALAGLLRSPAALGALLLANSIVAAALVAAAPQAAAATPWRFLLHRGLLHMLLFSAYVALVALLVGLPLLWLLRSPSLQATLTLSACSVLCVLLLWRAWPAFALLFLPIDAQAAERQVRSQAAARRCLRLAQQLSGEHELFFTHGLPSGLCLLIAALAALALAGAATAVSQEFFLLGLAGYALLLPMAHGVVLHRTLSALHLDRASAPIAAEHPVPAPLPLLPEHLDSSELDAALLRATRAGQVELACAALGRGADPDTLPPPHERDQRSVLVLAALLPDVQLLRALITRGADVNRQHNGLTALLAATRDSHSGRPEAVLTLLANGADTSLADTEGNTPLHHAARAADASIAAMLLDAGASLLAVNREGLTPLGVAASAANWSLLRFLLEHGARPEVEHAVPALLAAAAIGEDDPQGVRLLLKHRARADARGPMDRTPLMAAALLGHRAICRALLDGGAEPNLADRHGTTAVMEAARAGAAEVLRVLATRRPDPHVRDHAGRTALVIACQSRAATPDTVKVLLALGASATAAEPGAPRALDMAIQAARWDLVAALDPSHPLPAPVAEQALGLPLPGADSPAHLLDALRFGHWRVAEEFRGLLPRWSAAERAEVLYGLGEAEQARARDWLLAAGVSPDAALASGERVLDAWLGLLPVTATACEHLLHAGATVGGAGGVRRLLEAAREAPAHHSALVNLAREWLLRGGDPFAANRQGETVLHLAAALGAAELAALLLQQGLDPNARDHRGASPLHAALRVPGPIAQTLVAQLIAAGADPLATSMNGETPLGLALARGEPALVAWLQWRGWRLPGRRLRDADLVAATIAADAEAVDKLLRMGLAVDATDAQGATALLRACGLGHLTLLPLLLAAGANLEFAAPTGATPLSAAVSVRRDAVVDALLRHGADPNHRLPGGGSVLMIAAALGYPEIAERLLAAGADPRLTDEKGTTALHAAAQFAFGHSDTQRARALLAALCRAGGAVDAPNAKGQTALLLVLGARAEPGAPCVPAHLAALTSVLLDHGAALDAQDERGVSPLHACAIHGLLDAARILLARGAQRETRDCLGRTAGDIALLLGYTELAQQLGRAAPPPSLAQMLRRAAPGQD